MLSDTHTFFDWTIDYNSKFLQDGAVLVSQAHNPVGAIAENSKKISASCLEIGNQCPSMPPWHEKPPYPTPLIPSSYALMLP